MFLQINFLRMERKEIVREKTRIKRINTTLSEHNLSSERTQKLEKIRKESVAKIEVLEAHSQKLWDEIQTRLRAENIYEDDIKAFQLRYLELHNWVYVAGKCNDTVDNIRKRLERISKAMLLIPDDKGVI